jgi:hypothetical protein
MTVEPYLNYLWGKYQPLYGLDAETGQAVRATPR